MMKEAGAVAYMGKPRFDWIDVAKSFGMFAIYLGHFNTDAGYSLQFVFSYHVPMFFFLSGCLETLNTETNILKNIKKKALSLLIPYVFFAVASTIQCIFQYNVDYASARALFTFVLQGSIRNTFPVYQLWFFTCLFSVSVIFEVFKKLKYKVLIVGLSLLLFIVAEKILPVRPIIKPSWFFNIDSAFFYIVYFALGYALFPLINRLLFSKTKAAKVFLFVSAALTSVYAVRLYFQIDLLNRFNDVHYLSIAIPIVRALLVIWPQLILAQICRNFGILRDLGKNSLYLCGSEYFVKSVAACAVSIVGLKITTANPFSAMLYAALLMLIVHKYMVPIESKCITAIKAFCTKSYKKPLPYDGISA